MRIPGVEEVHLRQRAHLLAVALSSVPSETTTHLAREAVVIGSHHDARRQAQHVPLERCGMGLIEVVDVEGHRAFGRGEHAEVGDVGIAAGLHVDAARGHARQVRGHDQGRAAVERERRRQHPSVPDGHEAGRPPGRLLKDQGHRIRSIGGRGRQRS